MNSKPGCEGTNPGPTSNHANNLLRLNTQVDSSFQLTGDKLPRFFGLGALGMNLGDRSRSFQVIPFIPSSQTSVSPILSAGPVLGKAFEQSLCFTCSRMVTFKAGLFSLVSWGRQKDSSPMFVSWSPCFQRPPSASWKVAASFARSRLAALAQSPERVPSESEPGSSITFTRPRKPQEGEPKESHSVPGCCLDTKPRFSLGWL